MKRKATSSAPDFASDSLHSEAHFKFLAVWPRDLKEHWALCHIIQGFCHMCKVPKNRLSVTEEVHEPTKKSKDTKVNLAKLT